MKTRLVLMILGACLVAGNGMAQTGPAGRGANFDPKAMADRQTQLMKDSLDLSADQLSKVEVINLKYTREMAAIREANQGDRETIRAKMQELRPKQEKELQAVLNPDQWSEYVRIRQAMRQNFQQRQGAGGRP